MKPKTTQEIKQKVINVLQQIYKEHKDRGINAIYLWGSITEDTFNPEKSDVDSIAIVSDNSNLIEQEINQKIKNLAPHINDFDLRLVHLKELNENISQNYLTKYICPEQLIFELPNWEFICGKKYYQKDFDIEPNLDNIIKFYESKIKLDLENLEKKPKIILGKTILKKIYFEEQKEGNLFPFSYTNMLKYTSDKNIGKVKKLLEIKARNWNKDELKKFIETEQI